MGFSIPLMYARIDIDVAQVYDVTPYGIFALEALGFFDVGTGPRLVPDGQTALSALIPTCTDCGKFGCGHSVTLPKLQRKKVKLWMQFLVKLSELIKGLGQSTLSLRARALALASMHISRFRRRNLNRIHMMGIQP